MIKNPSVGLPYIEKWLSEFERGLNEAGFLRKFKKILDAISKDK
jgi:hypothetical protein